MGKAWKIVRNILIGVLALVLVLMIAFQILMRPSVLTRTVNRLAADYVEGDVSFREVRAHLIKSFPFVTIDAKDFAITYPHERYAAYDSIYPTAGQRFSLMRMGNARDSSGVDTLMALRRLHISLNYMAFLQQSEIHLHRIELEHPRIFAHYFDSTAANWDILPLNSTDTSAEKKPLPPIIIREVALTDRPLIVYTNPVDTLHGLFTPRRMTLDGQVDTRAPDQASGRFRVDSLMVSGRLPKDTVALRLDYLQLDAEERHIQLVARAAARLATNHYGRLRVPLEVDADVTFPQRLDGALEADIHSLQLKLATIGLQGEGRVVKEPELWDLDVKAAIRDCPLGDLIKEYRENIPALKKIDTDARISLDASVAGKYGAGQTPAVDARLQVPPAVIDYEGLGRKGRLALDAVVTTDDLKAIDAQVKRVFIDFAGARVDASGSARDLLGKDPLFVVDGEVKTRLDSVTRLFLKERGISGTGRLEGRVSGRARLSQLNMARIGSANIDCHITGQGLSVQDLPDQLTAFLPKLELDLATRANKIDRNIPEGARVLALKAGLDTVNVTLKDMFVRGREVTLLMQNSAEILKGGKELTPLMGILKVGNLHLKDQEGLSVNLRKGTERFRISPATAERQVPRLSLVSQNERLNLRTGHTSVMMHGVNFDLAAARHQARPRNQGRREHLLDSLQRVYPGVPRDSLFRKARLQREALASRDDFASSDLTISLSDAIRDYMRNWDIEGNIDLKLARPNFPAFPLSTVVTRVQGSFSNDTLNLKNITAKAGRSDLSAQARLTGLRRAILGRGRSLLKLKADVQSHFIDANQLLRAYAYYITNEPRQDGPADAEEEEPAPVPVELPDEETAKSQLIVLPSNLEVDFSLEASGIRYDSLLVSWAAADVAMRNRTLQVTNALAASNMGDIYFEGFYATRSKDDIKAGFDLNMVHITAEKVITLFPSVDTIMPMLTTFAGDLDCELAATTEIDTCMNLILPSIDGVLKISGKDLTLKESKEFTNIAKKLMFKDSETARVDNMTVTGIIRNNILEVYPFVLDVDRYTFAASGLQHLDHPFDYHISVIRSPLLVKFGLNAWGQDFDHVNYRLGRARYRSAQVPVFTKQLDTVQYSLVAAIHNIFELGVEKAMAENRTEQYLRSQFRQEADSLAVEVALADSLRTLGLLQDEVAAQAALRREQLREEIIRLEKEAALKNEAPEVVEEESTNN